jgi:uncharacterized protein YndB with AHSA1/START domain
MPVIAEKRGDTRSYTFTAPLPPQQVYDYLSDFHRHCEWTQELLSMEKTTEGPLGVGTQYRTLEAMKPGSKMQDTTSCEITVLEPPRRIEWRARTKADRGPMAMRSRWAFAIEPDGPGSRVTQSYAMEPPNVFARAFLAVFSTIGDLFGGMGATPKNVKKHAENLEAILNRPGGPGAAAATAPEASIEA